MKKCLCFIVSVILIISAVTIVSATTDHCFLGDADLDGEVTIMDATRIQRVVADLDTLSEVSRVTSDADSDSDVTIMDATRIQRWLAELCNMDGSVPYDPRLPLPEVDASKPSDEQPTISPTAPPAESETVFPTTPTVPPTVAPTSPTKVMLPTPHIIRVAADNNGALIYWTKVSGAEKYRVFIKNGTSWKGIGDTTSDHIAYTGAKQNTSYTYTVRCISANGKEFTSDYDRTGYTAKIFSKPVVSSVTVSGTAVIVRWASVGSAKYRVFVRTGSNWKSIGDTSATSYAYTHTDKTVTEYYTVRCLAPDGSYFTSGYDTVGKQFKYVSLSEATYIGNNKTHKFHYTTCRDVPKILAGNKVAFRTRSEAINSGYSPCGHCNP